MLTILASYPRSGNTWLRFLIAAAVGGPINSLEQMARIVPDIHQTGGNIGAAKIFKTHFLPSNINCDDARSILLMRHPLDVAVSVAHYLCRERITNATPEQLARQLIEMFSQTGGFGISGWERFGSWLDHSEKWLERGALLIRYEDMKTDVETELKKVLSHSSLESLRLSDAVAECTLERLKHFEDGGHKLGPRRQYDMKFFRSGESGQWSELITDRQLKRISRKFGITLDALGYNVSPKPQF